MPESEGYGYKFDIISKNFASQYISFFLAVIKNAKLTDFRPINCDTFCQQTFI